VVVNYAGKEAEASAVASNVLSAIVIPVSQVVEAISKGERTQVHPSCRKLPLATILPFKRAWRPFGYSFRGKPCRYESDSGENDHSA
jgi:hypothetical protein